MLLKSKNKENEKIYQIKYIYYYEKLIKDNYFYEYNN